MISTPSLQHTQRGNSHPLATGYQDRYHIFCAQPFGSNTTSNTVADGIHLGIGVFLVLINHGDVFGCRLGLTTEQRDDGLRVVIVHIRLVEAVEHLYLRGCRNIDIAKKLLGEESLDHSLIALQILTDNLLRIFVAIVFCFHLILTIQDKGFQIERSFQGAVAETDGLHRLAAQLLVGKHHAVPGKHRVAL